MFMGSPAYGECMHLWLLFFLLPYFTVQNYCTNPTLAAVWHQCARTHTNRDRNQHTRHARANTFANYPLGPERAGTAQRVG